MAPDGGFLLARFRAEGTKALGREYQYYMEPFFTCSKVIKPSSIWWKVGSSE